jgi:hypothetical protein
MRTVRRITRQLRAYREKLISLVVLPVFFFGTMPHTACICADGHREEFCKAAICRALNQGASTTQCCGCSCCKNAGGQKVRSCCQSKSCEPASGSETPVNGVAAKKGSCCHPYLEDSAPATVSGKASLGSQLVIAATAVGPITLVSADEYLPTLNLDIFSTPPPLDAVIVYLHLTI